MAIALQESGSILLKPGAVELFGAIQSLAMKCLIASSTTSATMTVSLLYLVHIVVVDLAAVLLIAHLVSVTDES